MKCIEIFRWRDEPIADIVEWTRERGGEMVRYHAKRTVPDLRTGGLVDEEYDGEMPDVFWDGLAMMHGWYYVETGRYRPSQETPNG